MTQVALAGGSAGGTVTEPIVANTRIPARSKREAMDWGLALVSQDIETTIESPETGGWGLSVGAQDYERALAVIRQYRAENSGWLWQRRISRRGPLFDWGSLAWLFLLGLFFELQQRSAALEAAGLMDSAALSRGEWWRLFTAVWLHADTSHLASNAVIGVLLLGLTMGGYGTGIGLWAAFMAGAGGNVATWLVHSADHRSLGASGMVTGCIGLLAVTSVPLVFQTWKRKSSSGATSQSIAEMRLLVSGMAAGLMLFVLLGLNAGTDVAAHLGGFVSGLALGPLLQPVTKFARKTVVNVVAGILFCLMVILTWWLALSRGPLR